MNVKPGRANTKILYSGSGPLLACLHYDEPEKCPEQSHDDDVDSQNMARARLSLAHSKIFAQSNNMIINFNVAREEK